MIEPALVAHVLADPAVAALIDVRITKPPAPEGQEVPFVTYMRAGRSTPITITGERGPHRVRFQFDSWAVTDFEATTVADAVEEALVRFRGPKTNAEVFLTDFTDRDEDLFEPAPVNLHRVSRDYFVHFSNA